MNIEQLKQYTVDTLNFHIKMIKPWKKSERVNNDWPTDYAVGWNDCIKEMEKRHKEFMKTAVHAINENYY